MLQQSSFRLIIKTLTLILAVSQLPSETSASPQQRGGRDMICINILLAQLMVCSATQERAVEQCDKAYCEGLSRLGDPSQGDPAGALQQLWEQYEACVETEQLLIESCLTQAQNDYERCKSDLFGPDPIESPALPRRSVEERREFEERRREQWDDERRQLQDEPRKIPQMLNPRRDDRLRETAQPVCSILTLSDE